MDWAAAANATGAADLIGPLGLPAKGARKFNKWPSRLCIH